MQLDFWDFLQQISVWSKAKPPRSSHLRPYLSLQPVGELFTPWNSSHTQECPWLPTGTLLKPLFLYSICEQRAACLKRWRTATAQLQVCIHCNDWSDPLMKIIYIHTYTLIRHNIVTCLIWCWSPFATNTVLTHQTTDSATSLNSLVLVCSNAWGDRRCQSIIQMDAKAEPQILHPGDPSGHATFFHSSVHQLLVLSAVDTGHCGLSNWSATSQLHTQPVQIFFKWQ